jgi:hypothetical protein
VGNGISGGVDGDHRTAMYRTWGSPCRDLALVVGRTAGLWRGRVGPSGRDCGNARQLGIGCVVGWGFFF